MHVVVNDVLNYLELRGSSAHHCTKTINEAIGAQKIHERSKEEQANGLNGTLAHDLRLIVLSAADEDSVHRQKESYSEYTNNLLTTSKTSPTDHNDFVYALGERRTLFLWRAFVIASDYSELKAGLDTMLEQPSRAIPGNKLTFCITGQGAQRSGMGKELMTYTVSRASVQAADDYLSHIGCTWSIKSRNPFSDSYQLT